jgi:hypothetical protein
MEMSWKRWKPVKKNKVTVLAFLNLLKKFKPFVIQMLKSYPPPKQHNAQNPEPNISHILRIRLSVKQNTIKTFQKKDGISFQRTEHCYP